MYWHYTAIWDLLHRWRDLSPSSGAKVALLWAVTFVPEWNFDSFLYLCCCCFLFLFSFCFPSGVCPLCTHANASFDNYSTIVKTHQSQRQRWYWELLVPAVKEENGQILSGKQESGEMSAPSGRFSSIHQLPWCTPKIEKPLFFFLQSPRQALLMCFRRAKDFLCVQANTQSSLFCKREGGLCP